VPVSQYDAMRAPFQEGDFPGPVKYGYSSVGEVIEAPGPRVSSLLGRSVFCLYPHQDLYRAPADALYVLPSDLPPGRAVLAANMETAVNAVWDARPTVGDEIVVIGAGVVGMLVAWLSARIPGTRVTVVDTDRTRDAVARELGLDCRPDPPTEIRSDVVFHASGTDEGLATALTVTGVEATVIELSWYGSRPAILPLGEHFHSRRLTLKSSQVGRIPIDRAPRWTFARRMGVALELLRDPRLDVLISGESVFDALPETMAQLARDGRGVLCHRILYPHS
jgi:threonine dehydrogenase-like Zn-dependent dehydrogenase